MIFYLLSPRLPLAQCALLTALHPTIHPPPQLRHRAWAGPRTTCGAAGGALGPGLPPRTEAGPPGRAQWNNAPLSHPPLLPRPHPLHGVARRASPAAWRRFPSSRRRWVGGWVGRGCRVPGGQPGGRCESACTGAPAAAALRRRQAGRLLTSLPSSLPPSPCPQCPTRPLPAVLPRRVQCAAQRGGRRHRPVLPLQVRGA